MSPKKSNIKSKKKHDHDPHPHLRGYLMIAFGLLGLSLNFDLLEGLEWAKAYPLLLVLLGIVMLAEIVISREVSK